MTNIKVSICIAVYNGEKFLHRCLDSVVNQTLKEKEIIIVNDGSTDNSLKILNEYKNLYPEITIINLITNKGLCNARKIGVKYAKGEYIGFVDCDDYIDLKMYEKMYNVAVKYNVDIVECRYKNIKVGTSNKKYYNCNGTFFTGKMDSKKVLQSYFYSKNLCPMLWFRIYKNGLFDDLSLFPSFYTSNEDEFIFPCLLYKSSNIYFYEEILYYKISNDISVMAKVCNNYSNFLKYIYDMVRVESHVENFIGERKFKRELMYFKNLILEGLVYKGLKFNNTAKVLKGILSPTEIIRFKKFMLKKHLKNNKMFRSLNFYNIIRILQYKFILNKMYMNLCNFLFDRHLDKKDELI